MVLRQDRGRGGRVQAAHRAGLQSSFFWCRLTPDLGIF